MRSETQVFSLVNSQADLLHISMPSVIPEKPAPAIVDRVGFIASVVVPLIDAGAPAAAGITDSARIERTGGSDAHGRIYGAEE